MEKNSPLKAQESKFIYTLQNVKSGATIIVTQDEYDNLVNRGWKTKYKVLKKEPILTRPKVEVPKEIKEFRDKKEQEEKNNTQQDEN